MRIVVLDGYTENPGDLSWSGFEGLGELTVYDRTPASLIVERARDAEALILNKAVITSEIIDACPKLRYIGVLATGYNNIDIAYAKKKLIPVCNIPTYGTDTVAQMTFAFILEVSNKISLHSQSVIKGDWGKCDDFCYTLAPLMEIKGKTLGLIGYGKIGRAVAKIALAFGMRVVAYDAYFKEDDGEVKLVELDKLYAQSDFISLHCFLTPENTRMINAQSIAKMKTGVYIINTARGQLLDETDVAAALYSGKLGGVMLDVIGVEPPKAGNPLIGAPNAIITPHIAWATKEARSRLMDIAVANLKAFLNGDTVNCVWNK